MKELPVRKNIRLKDYDYSSSGCYFITICVKDRHELLGKVVVGDAVLSVPHVQLTDIGKTASDYLYGMSASLESVKLDKYIIMPNHIHCLIRIESNGTLGTASPTKATIPQIVHGLKTCTTKAFGESMWQRSYHDHVIRNETEYRKIWRYIDTNPSNWEQDCYYK